MPNWKYSHVSNVNFEAIKISLSLKIHPFSLKIILYVKYAATFHTIFTTFQTEFMKFDSISFMTKTLYDAK